MPSGVPSAPAAPKDLSGLGCHWGCGRGLHHSTGLCRQTREQNAGWGCSDEPHQGPILREPTSTSSHEPSGTRGEKRGLGGRGGVRTAHVQETAEQPARWHPFSCSSNKEKEGEGDRARTRDLEQAWLKKMCKTRLSLDLARGLTHLLRVIVTFGRGQLLALVPLGNTPLSACVFHWGGHNPHLFQGRAQGLGLANQCAPCYWAE